MRKFNKIEDVKETHLLDMPLHTWITAKEVEVFRVYNGWIYWFHGEDGIFVPEVANVDVIGDVK